MAVSKEICEKYRLYSVEHNYLPLAQHYRDILERKGAILLKGEEKVKWLEENFSKFKKPSKSDDSNIDDIVVDILQMTTAPEQWLKKNRERIDEYVIDLVVNPKIDAAGLIESLNKPFSGEKSELYTILDDAIKLYVKSDGAIKVYNEKRLKDEELIHRLVQKKQASALGLIVIVEEILKHKYI